MSVALLGLPPADSSALSVPPTNAVLPLLVTQGRAPAAALLALEGTTTRYAHAGQGIARSDHFRAGSVTKTFIATVVLQLAAEHRLSLSDTVEQHLPGLVRGAGNDGRALTLRSLLTHTSGLYDYTKDTGGTTPVTPRQAVRIALTHPPAERGRFSYSNTNYVLLGLVVEQVTGHSYATEAERRIITPLGLTGTSFPGSRSSLPSPHGRAYAADGTDVTDLDPRVASAAGELVTTLADLDRFYSALLGGRLLPAPAARDARHPCRTRRVRHGPVPRETAVRHHGVGAQRAHIRQLRAHRSHRRRPACPHLPCEHGRGRRSRSRTRGARGRVLPPHLIERPGPERRCRFPTLVRVMSGVIARTPSARP
ncbi:serine hydrolase domain-containing protein [Streptomyces sp. DG1A-41]|uniref:serine hydrolase domain-containing protein n=1 Tax=Streptomyces sp. DG1A-41 TaxID=3125779 RepID=UPI0030D0026B